MKTLLNLKRFFIFLLLYTISSPVNFVLAATINVPEGTIVPITVEQEYTTKDLSPGEKIDAIIENDVYINGICIFKEGSSAIIKVSNIVEAKMNGSPAILYLVNGEVTDTKGIRHEIEYRKKIIGTERPWMKASTRLGSTRIMYSPNTLLYGTTRGGEARLLPYQAIEGKLINSFKYNNEL